MQYLFSKEATPVLSILASESTLCAFDFDGTLAAIVGDPHMAVLRSRTRKLLAHLGKLYPCIVISGRAREDLLGKLAGLNVQQIIGNHGAEIISPSPARPLIAEWKAALEARLGTSAGIWTEDKGLCLAVHYRHAPNKAGARRRILAAARCLRQAWAYGGKLVVNIVVDGAPNKGDALKAERQRLGCAWILYVGDDKNDEDAFALSGNIVSVRIGRQRFSHAQYYLRRQAEIDKLLELLITLREPSVAAAIQSQPQ
jgi:trehalose 6-phosphate phosphatase